MRCFYNAGIKWHAKYSQLFSRTLTTSVYPFTFPAVESVNLAYQLYTGTDVDNGAPPLVIMHGLFGSKKNWNSMSQNFAKKLLPRRKIIAIDARNHGDSPHSSYHTYAHMAQDIVELLKQQNIDRAAVLGHSMGGRAMMYLALNYPNLVDRAIIVDVSPINYPRTFDSTEYLLHLIKSIRLSPELSPEEGRKTVSEELMRGINSPTTVDFLLQNFKKLKNGKFAWKFNINALESNLENITRFPENILKRKQFRGPILLIGGTKSEFVRGSELYMLKKSFPNLKLNWIDSGHLVHFEKPTEFTTMVMDFLNC